MKDPRDDWKNLRQERAKIEEREHAKMVVPGILFWLGVYAFFGLLFYCTGLADDALSSHHRGHQAMRTLSVGQSTGGDF